MRTSSAPLAKSQNALQLRGSVGNVDVVCRVDLHVPRKCIAGMVYNPVQSTKDGRGSAGGDSEWEVMKLYVIRAERILILDETRAKIVTKGYCFVR